MQKTNENKLMPKEPDMRIFRLSINNFLKVETADMAFDKDNHIYLIGGQNGAGKSSCLAAIDNILLGPDRKVTEIVHEGEQAYEVEMEFGTETIRYIAQRKGTNDKNGTLKIIRAADDSVLSTPSAFLEAIIGATFIDPMDFVLAQPKDQRAILAALSKLDTSDLDAEIASTRDQERLCERLKTEAEGKAKGLKKHEDAPAERPNIGEISQSLLVARSALKECEDALEVVDHRSQEKLRNLKRIKDLEAELTLLKSNNATLDKQIDEANAKAEPEVLAARQAEVTKIERDIEGIEEAQRKYDENKTVEAAIENWKQKEQDRVACVKAIDKLQAEKKKRLAEAKMPLPGLAFNEDGVLYNGKPFYQASDAEKLKVSMAISLAKDGRLKPIRIKNGSLLDDESLKMVHDIAVEHNAQVFIEVVANKKDGKYDRECSFVFEDGRIAEVANAKA